MRKTVQDVVFRFSWYRTKWEKRTNGTYTDPSGNTTLSTITKRNGDEKQTNETTRSQAV